MQPPENGDDVLVRSGATIRAVVADRAPVRVLVASEVRLYREGLAESLVRQPTVHVVGTACDYASVMAAVAQHRTDVVLLDVAMPQSLAMVRALLGVEPALKTVVVAVSDADGDILACAEAGVAGYVPRDGSLGQLLATIETVVRGELLCSPRLAAALFRRVAALSGERPPSSDPAAERLSPREREIVALIDSGLTNKAIAARLRIGVTTVKNHVHHILEKLGATRRGEAAARLRTMPRGSDRPSLVEQGGAERAAGQPWHR